MVRISVFGEKGRSYVAPPPPYVMGGTCCESEEQQSYSISPLPKWSKKPKLKPTGQKSPKRKRVVVETSGQATIINELGEEIYRRKLKIKPSRRIDLEVAEDFHPPMQIEYSFEDGILVPHAMQRNYIWLDEEAIPVVIGPPIPPKCRIVR